MLILKSDRERFVHVALYKRLKEQRDSLVIRYVHSHCTVPSDSSGGAGGISVLSSPSSLLSALTSNGNMKKDDK